MSTALSPRWPLMVMVSSGTVWARPGDAARRIALDERRMVTREL